MRWPLELLVFDTELEFSFYLLRTAGDAIIPRLLTCLKWGWPRRNAEMQALLGSRPSAVWYFLEQHAISGDLIMHDLVVVGGGPAGLHLAFRMAEAGYETVLSTAGLRLVRGVFAPALSAPKPLRISTFRAGPLLEEFNRCDLSLRRGLRWITVTCHFSHTS